MVVESKFKLVRTHDINTKKDDEFIEMGYVQSFTESVNNRIIIREAASGNSSVVYNNGIETIQIPIDVKLIGDDIDDLERKKNLLFDLVKSGETVEFLSPYNNPTSSNRYFISKPVFVTNQPNPYEKIGSLTLIEAKDVVSKILTINLINFASKRAFLNTYNNRTGNLIEQTGGAEKSGLISSVTGFFTNAYKSFTEQDERVNK